MVRKHSKDPQKVKLLLDKLRAMAERGEKNERIVAKIKLEDLLVKYDIQGNYDKSNKRIFKVKDWADHKNLLLQCIVDTKPYARMEGYKAGKKIIVELDELEYILVSEKWEFYWKEYLIQKEALFAAFVLKNKIGIGNNYGDEEIIMPIDIKMVAKLTNLMTSSPFVNKRQKTLPTEIKF